MANEHWREAKVKEGKWTLLAWRIDIPNEDPFIGYSLLEDGKEVMHGHGPDRETKPGAKELEGFVFHYLSLKEEPVKSKLTWKRTMIVKNGWMLFAQQYESGDGSIRVGYSLRYDGQEFMHSNGPDEPKPTMEDLDHMVKCYKMLHPEFEEQKKN